MLFMLNVDLEKCNVIVYGGNMWMHTHVGMCVCAFLMQLAAT